MAAHRAALNTAEKVDEKSTTAPRSEDEAVDP